MNQIQGVRINAASVQNLKFCATVKAPSSHYNSQLLDAKCVYTSVKSKYITNYHN
jgi:hypothetical protein